MNKSKIYFTCPIQVLYMTKEFGVVFEKSWQLSECKIYVLPESEAIFEPKEGDLDSDGFCFTEGSPVVNHMTGEIDYYTEACWLIQIEEFVKSKEKSKTIFRDNKQFFSGNSCEKGRTMQKKISELQNEKPGELKAKLELVLEALRQINSSDNSQYNATIAHRVLKELGEL